MLNHAPDCYIERISKLLTTCYHNNSIPQNWREGTTVLLPKPNTDPSPDGFRPITLLSVEYKLFSHIINHSLVKWLTSNKVIPDWQNGALFERGCDTSLWTYLTAIKHSNLFQKEIHALYIDFKKAYDSVEHWVFEVIFEHLNIGFAGKVILNMLDDSYTQLRVNNNIIPTRIPFNRGVKQGDVISPILFLLFMAPLMHTINDYCKGYNVGNTRFIGSAIMDDLLVVTDNLHDADCVLGVLMRFSKITGMEINASKSAYAWNHCTEHLNPIINNAPFKMLDSTKHYRYLGVWISLDLNWSVQQDQLKTSLWATLHRLEHKFYISQTNLVKLIRATVFSFFGYRMQVIIFNEKWLRSIESSIIRFLNRISRTSSFASATSWFSIFKCPSLVELNHTRYINSFFRNANNATPCHLFLQEALNFPTTAYPHWPHPSVVFDRYNISPQFSRFSNQFNTSTITLTAPSPNVNPISIFTDGSLILEPSPRMHAGFYTPSESRLVHFHVNGFIGSTEPELQAIHRAIATYLCVPHITLFTDSLNSIILISSLKYNVSNLLKCQNRVTLRAICQLIQNRTVLVENEVLPANCKSSIRFIHIFSHTDKKKDKYDKLKEKFGEKTDEFISYNNHIDSAVQFHNTTLSYAHPLLSLSYSDRFAFTSKSDNTIINDIKEYTQFEATTKTQSRWYVTDPTKASRALHVSIDFDATTHIIRTSKCASHKLSNFLFKQILNILPTNSTSHLRSKSKIKYHHCKSCANKGILVTESHNHIFSECYDVAPVLNSLAYTILDLCNDFLNKQWKSLPFWFPNDLPPWVPISQDERDLVDFDKALGARGFIPKALKTFINKYSLKSTTDFMDSILWILAHHLHYVWIERCDYLFTK